MPGVAVAAIETLVVGVEIDIACQVMQPRNQRAEVAADDLFQAWPIQRASVKFEDAVQEYLDDRLQAIALHLLRLAAAKLLEMPHQRLWLGEAIHAEREAQERPPLIDQMMRAMLPAFSGIRVLRNSLGINLDVIIAAIFPGGFLSAARLG